MELAANAPKPLILIVEDDHFLSDILQARLRKEGFRVLQAYNGEEAMETLMDIRPHLVLLDLIMPVVSGFEFLEKVSVDPNYRTIPIMVLSNLGQPSDIQRAKEFGAIAYFAKASMSIDDVVDQIKKALT